MDRGRMGLQSMHWLSLGHREALSVCLSVLSLPPSIPFIPPSLPPSHPPSPIPSLPPSLHSLHPSLHLPPLPSFIPPSLPPSSIPSLPPPLHFLPPFLPPSPILSLRLAPGQLRSPQQVSGDCPFRIQAQKMRQNRFSLLSFCFPTPLWAAAEIAPAPLTPSARCPSLGDTCGIRGQSQGPSFGGCAPAFRTAGGHGAAAGSRGDFA